MLNVAKASISFLGKTARAFLSISRENSQERSVSKKKIDVQDYKSDIGHIPKRKWKKNPLVPEPTAKKEIVVTDYLGKKRMEIRE